MSVFDFFECPLSDDGDGHDFEYSLCSIPFNEPTSIGAESARCKPCGLTEIITIERDGYTRRQVKP